MKNSTSSDNISQAAKKTQRTVEAPKFDRARVTQCPAHGRVLGPDCPGSSEADSLLYLYSNNSDKNNQKTPLEISDLALQTANLLTNYHRKQAHTLSGNVARLISLCPSENHVGFLTLTFKENVVDFKEASRRFDNLRKKLLNENSNFGIWIRATERQKRGAVHYHLVIETKEDIKTGFDWTLYRHALNSKKPGQRRKLEREAFRTANPYLRSLWKLLRESMEKYGFGRSELLPIRSTAEAMSFYLGKYISKHIGAREKRDKGIRLICYSQGWVKNSVKLSWYNENSIKWRQNVQKFVNYYFGPISNRQTAEMVLTMNLGSRWAWHFRDTIIEISKIVEIENTERIPF
jgi:hypothetical protein